MRSRLFGLVLLLATPLALIGQSDKAPAPKPVVGDSPIVVPEGGFADHTISVPKDASIIWRYSPQPEQIAKNLPPGRIIFSGKPGVTYTATAFVIDFNAKTVTDADYKFTFGGKPVPPSPPDPPGPNPPDPPAPTGKITRFVVVEDTAAPGAWRGEVLGNPKVASFYRQLKGASTGPIHRLIDVKGDAGDPVAAYFIKAANGKQLPYLWMLDADGKIVRDLRCPTDPDAFVAAFGDVTPRAMGLNFAKPKLQWRKVGDPGGNVPYIPRAQWKPIDLGVFLPPVHDQDGIGQCASSAACALMETVRTQSGLTYTYFSAGDLYSRVNGGRDGGSSLEDNMAELLTNGVGTTALAPYVWNYKRPVNTAAAIAERKKYRAVEVYLCPDFDAMVSALLQGFIVEHGLSWGDSQMSVDRDGWIADRAVGHVGGHALVGYGVTMRNGVVGIKTRNSWGTSWGGSQDGTIGAGNCVIPEKAFAGDVGGYYAVRAVTQTTGDNWPTPHARRLEIDNPFRVRRGEFVLAP